MSAKWIRSKQWDEQNIPSWAWPAKFLLRAFSSITLAVILLSLVVLYAILASVPVGLIVLGLTFLFYGVTLLAALVGIGLFPIWVLRRFWKPSSGGPSAARFVVTLLGGLVLCLVAAAVWQRFAWPQLQYDPAHHTGVRFFGSFVDQYRSTTLRRLPGFEMSELEFYSWWPLRVVLLLFVINMVTATVRRIEFTFPNIGVLTVHTGIVLIALGSIYYKGLKQEGDTLLWAGPPGNDGQPTAGAPQSGFYDNTQVALWTKVDEKLWEQRPIQPPRYNDYNLSVGSGLAVDDVIDHAARTTTGDAARILSVPVPRPEGSKLDPDITFRLVGYASYAESKPTWVKADPPASGKPQPVRFAELIAHGKDPAKPGTMAAPFFFLPDLPAQRLGETEVFGLEYTRGMSAERFTDLTAELPPGTQHALVVDVPAHDGKPAFHAVYAANIGDKIDVGDTGYKLEVKDLAPQPPFPIITAGYRDATSSVAIVHVVPPTSSSADAGAPPSPATTSKPFDRYVYHRFPEINQDLLDELNERGMPKRRDADPAIRIAYIDASKLQVYLDEQPTATPDAAEAAPLRVIIRLPSGRVRVVENVAPGSTIADLMPGLDIHLMERWAHAEQVERPKVVADKDRRKDEIGTHGNAMLAVEVNAKVGGTDWSHTIWLPFTKYLMSGLNTERSLDLPDGRKLTLAFGRIRHPLPGFLIQLRNFNMIAYDHRGAPRDYQSELEVVPTHNGEGPLPFKPYIHLASLNAPLQAPFHWDDSRSWFANAFGTLSSRLSPRQFKFSQAGWDQQTWAQTQQLVDEGKLPRPYVQFTILGVGNNPGIHIIALGAILMSVGIPWAFYIKPLILKRRRDKLKAAHVPRIVAQPRVVPSTVDSHLNGSPVTHSPDSVGVRR